MGRFSGIFNQPAEAGVMYAIGLILAVNFFRHRPMWLLATGAVLTIGGLLTASKIFLLVGLPIALWQVWRASTWRGRAWAGLVICAVVAFVQHQTSQDGDRSRIGGELLGVWLAPGDSGDSLVSLYSAGRFGENSTLADAAMIVLGESPWFGFGAKGIAIAYDSSWVEALVMAGLFGVAIHALILATLAWCWLRSRRSVAPTTARLGGGLLLIVAIGSLGLPTLTANRVATVVWLLICLLLIRPAATNDPAAAAGAGSGGGPADRAAVDAAPGPVPTGPAAPRAAVLDGT
jgi:hypothetical protein